MSRFTRKRKRKDAVLQNNIDVVEDKKDCIRAWGYKLLGKYSNCWNDLTWKERRNKILDQYDVLGIGPFFCGSGVDENLYNDYIDTWQQFFPSNTSPILFALTGTDANNSMYSVFYQHAKDIYGKDAVRGNTIFFSKIFGSGRGEYSSVSHIKPVQKYSCPNLLKDFIVKGPYVKELNPELKEHALQAQSTKEDETLEKIDKLIRDKSLYISSVWIECIIGHTKDILFLRQEFLMKLRALCDKYNIIIFCDEILTNIRTGKPFAYQHFEPFEPDYISFGKGLIVSGIAKVERINSKTHKPITHKSATYTTLQACPVRLAYSMRLLEWIQQNNLLDNICRVGQYALASFKAYDKTTTGIGLMLCTSLKTDTLRGVGRRVLPAIDLQQSDIDCYLLNCQHDNEVDRFHMSYCGLCALKGTIPTLRCMSCPQSYHIECHIDKFPEQPSPKIENFKCDDCRSNMD